MSLDAGNITVDDAIKLRRLEHMLYKHIYSHYEEMKEMKELNEMTDESLLLDVEIMQKEHEKAMAELEKENAALAAEIVALKATLAKYENI